jgi:hypothetical protein
MTAKLYSFPSGNRIKGQAMSGEALVCAVLVSFAVVILMIRQYTR